MVREGGRQRGERTLYDASVFEGTRIHTTEAGLVYQGNYELLRLLVIRANLHIVNSAIMMHNVWRELDATKANLHITWESVGILGVVETDPRVGLVGRDPAGRHAESIPEGR